jgi:diguanylate cyclase (GGDEF)-like protein
MCGFGPPTLDDGMELFRKGFRSKKIKDTFSFSLKWFKRPMSLKTLLAQILNIIISKIKKGKETGKEPESDLIGEKIRNISSLQVQELLDDQEANITKVEPIQELFDDSLMDIVFEHGVESWTVADRSVETSLMQLNSAMMASGYYSTMLDRRFRSMRGHATWEQTEKLVLLLEKDCRNYLETQESLTKEINEQVEQFGELKWLAEKVDMANMENSSQIETTLSNLKQLDIRKDPEAAVERLITELAHLRNARHRLRDIQEEAFIAAIHYEKREESSLMQQNGLDKITGLANRISFEWNLWNWWKNKRHEKNQLTFALYDIAGFGTINDHIGIENSDNLLKFLANMIYEKIDGRDYVGLYRGNCLVSVSQNIGLRKTVASVEKIRQELDHLRFQTGPQEDLLEMKITCAVTEATRESSEKDMIATLEETLRTAKANGRNLTYQWDRSGFQTHPEEVDAPDFRFRERIIGLRELEMVPEEPQFPEWNMNEGGMESMAAGVVR